MIKNTLSITILLPIPYLTTGRISFPNFYPIKPTNLPLLPFRHITPGSRFPNCTTNSRYWSTATTLIYCLLVFWYR
jgi:hypothetical protein